MTPIPKAVPMTEIDLADDDSLRFIQRVLESNAPESDRKAALEMVYAIRRRLRKVYAAGVGVPQPPLRFDVLQEIAQTFGLDYNAVCRCANAYLDGVGVGQDSRAAMQKALAALELAENYSDHPDYEKTMADALAGLRGALGVPVPSGCQALAGQCEWPQLCAERGGHCAYGVGVPQEPDRRSSFQRDCDEIAETFRTAPVFGAAGVEVRNPTQQEDRVLREAAKRSSKVVDPGRLAAGVGVPKEAEPRIVECDLCALRRNADTCPVFRCPHKPAAGVGVPDGR